MGSETFADRLKLAMELRNMKQVDLIQAAADQGIRLGKSHVSQYVNGKTIPRADILKGLAKALQLDGEWLESGEAEEEGQIR